MRRLWRWFRGLWRPEREESVLTEFYGGPKDGDREVVIGDVYPVVTAIPVALSPWGQEDREASDMCRVVVVGRYVRTPEGMAWRAET